MPILGSDHWRMDRKDFPDETREQNSEAPLSCWGARSEATGGKISVRSETSEQNPDTGGRIHIDHGTPLPEILEPGHVVRMVGSHAPPMRCGRRFLMECQDCGNPFKMTQPADCMSPACSHCYRSWRQHRAETLAFRVQVHLTQAYLLDTVHDLGDVPKDLRDECETYGLIRDGTPTWDLQEALSGQRPRRAGVTTPFHVIISPPDRKKAKDTWTLEDLNDAWDRCWEMLEAHGAKGAVGVLHWWEGKRGNWRVGPHFHFVAVSHLNKLKPGGRRSDKGWVFKVKPIHRLDAHFLKGPTGKWPVVAGIYRLAYYEMGHAATVEKPNGYRYQSTKWFGLLNNRNIAMPEALKDEEKRLGHATEPVHCPWCGSTNVKPLTGEYDILGALAFLERHARMSETPTETPLLA